MNLYEGMFVFPDTIREEDVDEAAARVRAEIEKLGGAIESLTRIGQRAFARALRKRRSGHYAVCRFRLAGEALPELRRRLKLAGEVFRMQVLRVRTGNPEPAPGTEPAPSDAIVQ